MVKWGIWTGMYAEMDLPAALQHLARLGWRDVELCSEHLERIVSSDGRKAAIEAVRSVAAGEGITFWQAHMWLELDVTPEDRSEAPERLDIARRWLDLAVELGVSNAVIHPGGRRRPLLSDSERQRVLEENVEAFSALSKHVDGTGLRICVENMLNIAGDQPRFGAQLEDLWALIEGVGRSNIGFCLDTGHAHVVGIDVPGAVRTLGPRLWASHIADNDTSGDQHRFPYGGTIGWEDVVAAYREVGYTGLWNMEVPGERCEPLAVRDLRLEYAAKLMQWLWR